MQDRSALASVNAPRAGSSARRSAVGEARGRAGAGPTAPQGNGARAAERRVWSPGRLSPWRGLGKGDRKMRDERIVPTAAERFGLRRSLTGRHWEGEEGGFGSESQRPSCASRAGTHRMLSLWVAEVFY